MLKYESGVKFDDKKLKLNGKQKNQFYLIEIKIISALSNLKEYTKVFNHFSKLL